LPLTFLTAGELFQGISKAEAQKISGLCSETRYPRGTSIFSKGDPSHSVYVLKSGLVRLISHSEKGTETILHILKPSEIFGELLLSEKKRPFAAIAIEDSVLTVISKEHFQLFQLVLTINLNFIGLLSKRLAKVLKVHAESGHTWSYHRLAKVLLQLSEKYGEEVPAGTLIKLHLMHEDVANLIGTTRKTVTTQLK
jgi:CRP-like cAMP-binding protein